MLQSQVDSVVARALEEYEEWLQGSGGKSSDQLLRGDLTDMQRDALAKAMKKLLFIHVTLGAIESQSQKQHLMDT